MKISKKVTKDFNKQLCDNKDMPKIIVLTEAEPIKRYGGDKMLIAPPLFYDEIMKKIPSGKLITTTEIRKHRVSHYSSL